MKPLSQLKQLYRLQSIKPLSKDDYYQYATHTKNDTKKFFKDIGLKPRHIDTSKLR